MFSGFSIPGDVKQLDSSSDSEMEGHLPHSPSDLKSSGHRLSSMPSLYHQQQPNGGISTSHGGASASPHVSLSAMASSGLTLGSFYSDSMVQDYQHLWFEHSDYVFVSSKWDVRILFIWHCYSYYIDCHTTNIEVEKKKTLTIRSVTCRVRLLKSCYHSLLLNRTTYLVG